jgi:ParB family chromosome partitioning protein
LISGERRLRASTLVGLTTVPAYIRIANDNESLVMALVENIQRHDLDPIEIALSYQRLIDEIQLTQMSERVGKKAFYNCELLRLLKLDQLSKQVSVTDSLV